MSFQIQPPLPEREEVYNKYVKPLLNATIENKAVDKIGAGDTMLSLISLCMKSSISYTLSLLIGSLAAALSVKNYGNKKEINKVQLIKSIENLLK